MIQFLTPFQNLQHLLETSKAPKRRIEISFEVRKRRQRKELKVLKKLKLRNSKFCEYAKIPELGPVYIQRYSTVIQRKLIKSENIKIG